MQQVLPLLPRPESAVDGECYTPEAEAPPLAASTFPNIDHGVLRGKISPKMYKCPPQSPDWKDNRQHPQSATE